MRDLAYPIDDILLKARIKYEPKRSGRGRRPPAPKDISASSRIWIIPTFPDHDETEAERNAKNKYAKKEFGDDSKSILWYNSCGKGLCQQVKYYDTIFEIWNGTDKRPYGWLKGPYRVIEGVELSAKFGERRYCIALIKKGTKELALDETGFRKMLGIQGDKRSPIKAEKDISTRTRLLRKRKRDSFLSWFRKEIERRKQNK